MPASTLHKSAQQGSRCPHLHVQEHNSRYARPKDARVYLLWRASMKMPSSPPHTRVERYARPPLGVHTEMHVPYARPRRYARWPLPARAKDGRASMDACKDARVAPVARAARMHASGRLWSFNRVFVASYLPATFTPRSGAM